MQELYKAYIIKRVKLLYSNYTKKELNNKKFEEVNKKYRVLTIKIDNFSVFGTKHTSEDDFILNSIIWINNDDFFINSLNNPKYSFLKNDLN